MTYLKNKNLKGQEGVTLILGILILSAVLAITFSLSTIIFIEVKSSGDLFKTEGSLYGATGVGEQAFFNYVRQVPSPGYTTNYGNNVTLHNTPEVSSSTNPTFTDVIPPNSAFSNTKKIYEFCTPADQDNGCGFGKAVVKYVNGSSPLTIYLCEWDPHGNYTSAPCTVEGTDQNYWLSPTADSANCGSSFPFQNSDGSVTITTSANCVSWVTNPSLQQEMIITNISTTDTITYLGATFDSSGTVGKGLPYVGKTGVIIRTENGSVGRKIKVEVPLK